LSLTLVVLKDTFAVRVLILAILVLVLAGQVLVLVSQAIGLELLTESLYFNFRTSSIAYYCENKTK